MPDVQPRRIQTTMPSEVSSLLADLEKRMMLTTRPVLILAIRALHAQQTGAAPAVISHTTGAPRGRPPKASEALSEAKADPDTTRAWVKRAVENAETRRPTGNLDGVGRPFRYAPAEYFVVCAYASPVGQEKHDILPEHEHLREEIERQIERRVEYAAILANMPPPKPGFAFNPPTHPDFQDERDAFDAANVCTL